MKKTIVLIAILVNSLTFAQQWQGDNNTTGPIERNGSVAISNSSVHFSLLANGSDDYSGAFLNLETKDVAFGSQFNRALLTTHRNIDGYARFEIQRKLSDRYTGSLLVYDDKGGWRFRTVDKPESTRSSLKMNIRPNGNVGIGIYEPKSRLHVMGAPLGQQADNESLVAIVEGKVSPTGNNSKLQILNKRFAEGSNWRDTSLRLQRVIDNSPQSFIDFGLKAYNSGIAFGTLYDNERTIKMIINDDGKVGIGSLSPDSELTVKGTIHCEEVLVDLSVPADYVFEKYYEGKSSLKANYNMPTLEEVEAFTKANHHLPEVPSAKDIQDNGLELKEMTNILLQKIEELTLYTIEQEKRIKALEAKLTIQHKTHN